MKNLILTLLVLFSLTVHAQKIRFTDSTNSWTTMSSDGDGCYFQNGFGYIADTVVHGIKYRSLHGAGALYFGTNSTHCGNCPSSFGGLARSFSFLIREDTIAGKVYYINRSENAADTLEHVLYDYNLHLGDSITYLFSGESLTDTVASIDSTIINGVYHKIFNMQCKSGTYRRYTVLEGVGYTNSPVYWADLPACFEYGESLVCFYQGNSRPNIVAPINSCATYEGGCPGFNADVFDNSIVCGTLSVNNISKQAPYLTINPNPAYDYINITTSDQFDNNTNISVYDISGICILKTKAIEHESTAMINVTSWNNGLYMVVIQNNEGKLKTQKITVIK